MRRMKRLMRELYKDEFEKKRFRLPPIKAKSLIVTLSFISIIVFGVTTLYNFNRFVTLEERVMSANSHVEDVLQRRANLFHNLINLTLNQSALEQEVFRHVADVRAHIGKGMSQGAPAGTAPVASVGQAVDAAGAVDSDDPVVSTMAGLPTMARLLAVVEQYPEIRSSVTYQQLMDKLVEIEDRISMRRDEFNEEVRIYNTLITSFPWYILARITGFERYHYFSLSEGMNGKVYKVPDASSRLFQRLLPIGMGHNPPPEQGRDGSGSAASEWIVQQPARVSQPAAEGATKTVSDPVDILSDHPKIAPDPAKSPPEGGKKPGDTQ